MEPLCFIRNVSFWRQIFDGYHYGAKCRDSATVLQLQLLRFEVHNIETASHEDFRWFQKRPDFDVLVLKHKP